MKITKICLGILITLLVLVMTVLPGRAVIAAAVEVETKLAVAIHVSEYTKSGGLSLNQVNGEYPWSYFQIYTYIEEAFISDGTPFVEVSDADIASGALLTAGGVPKYPILFSLATECITDTEAQAIRSYVSAGGFVYVGSSAWTRNQNGSQRSNFALATEMGMSSNASLGANNWTSIGITGSRVKKTVNHRLLSHLPLNVFMLWQSQNAYNDYSSNGAHQAWVTAPTTATTLASVEGTNTPILTVKSYGSGWFIYQSELIAISISYPFFRNAVEWAFENQSMPLVRVSAWPYPNQAAFTLRHDDITDPPNWLVAAEKQRGMRGQYFIVTSWVTTNITSALAYDISQGAVIGSHGKEHIGPDSQTYTNAYNNINDSLVKLKEWIGTRPKSFVAPFVQAYLDKSFQAISANSLTASGEQAIGPFPHYALSMTTEKMHYNFLEMQFNAWVNPSGSLLTSNDGTWGQSDIRSAVDYIYNQGGLINIYDHQGAGWLGSSGNESVVYYMDYSNTKSYLWKTTYEDIATWWPSKNAVSFNPQPRYYLDGIKRTLNITVAGATSNQTAIDIIRPQDTPVTVRLNGVLTSNFRQNGKAVKVNSGTKQNISLSWNDSNSPPVAVNDSYATTKDTALNISAPGVLTNDTDVNGDVLTASLVSGVGHGMLTLNSDGSFTYNPAAGYSGSDSFTYRAYDGKYYSNTATVSITVTVPNYPPVAVNDSYSAVKNTTLTVTAPGVLGNDTDANGDALTASLVSGVGHGALTLNANGSFTYTPASGYTGGDSFTYRAYDSKAYSNNATVSLTITNTAPAAVNDSYGTTKDAPLTLAAPGVLGNDTDANGDALTAELVSGVGHGALTLNANGSFTYTPASGYTGGDSFTYRAYDGSSYSGNAVVSITVTDTLVTFGLNSGAGVADENPNYLNAMRFQNTAGTGNLVKLEILFEDTTPAGKVRMGVFADSGGAPGSRLVDAGEVNVANGWVSISGLSLPVTQGNYYWLAFVLQNTNAIRGVGGQAVNSHHWYNFTYGALPATYNLNGPDHGSSNGQWVMRAYVAISGVNSPPVAANDSYNAVKNTTLTVNAPGVLGNDTDADGDPLTASLVSSVSHGTLTLNANGSFTYAPASGYTGGDSFTYRAYDSKAYSNNATVSLTITNTAPAAVNDSYGTIKDTPLTVAAPGVLGNDTDANGDALTASLVSGVSHGTLTLNANGSLTYTPASGYTGGDNFTYRAYDGTAYSADALVTLTVADSSYASFGLNDGQGAADENPNYLNAMRFRNTAGTGNLVKVEILFEDTTPNGKVRLGVYADSGGAPGARLLDAGEVNVSNGWVSISGLNLPVTQGTYYWLVFVLQNTNSVKGWMGQAANSHHWYSFAYGALPSSYNVNGPEHGSSNAQWTMRATVNIGP